METNIYEMRWHFLNVLLDGILDMSEEEIYERMKNVLMDSIRPPFIVMIVSPRLLGHSFKEKDNVLYSYREAITEYLCNAGYCVITSMDSYDNVRVLVSLCDKEETEFRSITTMLRDSLRERFEIESFIAIGSKKSSITEVYVSAREALEALTYKYLYSVKGIVDFNTILVFQKNPCDGFEIEVGRVLGCFKDGNLEKMKIRLSDLAEGIRNSDNVSNTGIKRKMIAIVINVLNIGEMVGVSSEEVLEGDDPYKWIMSQNHTERIIDWVMQICSYVRYRIDEIIDLKEKEFVDEAKNSIDHCETSREAYDVAKMMGIDEPYLDQIFRRKLHCDIKRYISNNH